MGVTQPDTEYVIRNMGIQKKEQEKRGEKEGMYTPGRKENVMQRMERIRFLQTLLGKLIVMYYSTACTHELNYNPEGTTKRKVPLPLDRFFASLAHFLFSLNIYADSFTESRILSLKGC